MRRTEPLSQLIARRRNLLAVGGALLTGAALAGSRRAEAQPVRAPRKIGIIGSGEIGGTVGELWVKAGHEVLFSSRRPERLKDMVARLGPLARAGTPQEAAAYGDAVLLAIPYSAYPDFTNQYGDMLAGKVVLDAGNAFFWRDGFLTNEVNRAGVGVTSAKYLPGTRLVRAFNAHDYGYLVKEANRSGERMAIPIAGDDQAAVALAASLVSDAGFDPVVVGDLKSASEFQMGARGYGQVVTARVLRDRLGLAR